MLKPRGRKTRRQPTQRRSGKSPKRPCQRGTRRKRRPHHPEGGTREEEAGSPRHHQGRSKARRSRMGTQTTQSQKIQTTRPGGRSERTPQRSRCQEYLMQTPMPRGMQWRPQRSHWGHRCHSGQRRHIHRCLRRGRRDHHGHRRGLHPDRQMQMRRGTRRNPLRWRCQSRHLAQNRKGRRCWRRTKGKRCQTPPDDGQSWHR